MAEVETVVVVDAEMVANAAVEIETEDEVTIDQEEIDVRVKERIQDIEVTEEILATEVKEEAITLQNRDVRNRILEILTFQDLDVQGDN